MRRLTSIMAVFVMILMMMPTLACAITPKMTRMQHDCCEQMHGRCGDMAKQGCCQVEVREDLSQLPSHVVVAPVLHIILAGFLYPTITPDTQELAGFRWSWPMEHSPPGHLIAETTVLRI